MGRRCDQNDLSQNGYGCEGMRYSMCQTCIIGSLFQEQFMQRREECKDRLSPNIKTII